VDSKEIARGSGIWTFWSRKDEPAFGNVVCESRGDVLGVCQDSFPEVNLGWDICD